MHDTLTSKQHWKPVSCHQAVLTLLRRDIATKSFFAYLVVLYSDLQERNEYQGPSFVTASVGCAAQVPSPVKFSSTCYFRFHIINGFKFLKPSTSYLSSCHTINITITSDVGSHDIWTLYQNHWKLNKLMQSKQPLKIEQSHAMKTKNQKVKTPQSKQ